MQDFAKNGSQNFEYPKPPGPCLPKNSPHDQTEEAHISPIAVKLTKRR